jgi:hypothetical protein
MDQLCAQTLFAAGAECLLPGCEFALSADDAPATFTAG